MDEDNISCCCPCPSHDPKDEMVGADGTVDAARAAVAGVEA